MLIVGAGGYASELLEICNQNDLLEGLVFFDNVNSYQNPVLFDQFQILTSVENAKRYLSENDPRFALGIGNPLHRKKLFDLFIDLGGTPLNIISKYSEIGSFSVEIKEGVNIMSGVRISNNVYIGIGSMIYYNSVITHDVVVKDFVEISPNVTILGKAIINENCRLGAGCIILPGIEVGRNVTIGAGAVVTKNVPPNTVVAGVPARVLT